MGKGADRTGRLAGYGMISQFGADSDTIFTYSHGRIRGEAIPEEVS